VSTRFRRDGDRVFLECLTIVFSLFKLEFLDIIRRVNAVLNSPTQSTQAIGMKTKPAPKKTAKAKAKEPVSYPTSGLASASEAAEFFGVVPKTIYRMVRDGDLEVVFVRNAIRIPWDALHAFVSKGRKQAVAG